MASSSSSLTVTVAVALLVMAVSVRTAQSQAQTCASKLILCAAAYAYLNSTTTPPNSCCDPIKEAVANDLQCLCNLFENPSILSGLGINVEQALRLPRLCGISSDASACNTAQASTGSGTNPPSGIMNFPQATDVGCKCKDEKDCDWLECPTTGFAMCFDCGCSCVV